MHTTYLYAIISLPRRIPFGVNRGSPSKGSLLTWNNLTRKGPTEVLGMVEEMGMTNEQYKGMLLDELEDWEEVLALAKESKDEKVITKANKQIEKINEKLKF